MTNEVSVTLTVEEKEALKSVKKLENSIDNLSKSSEKAFKRSDSALSSFKGNLAAIATSNIAGRITSGIFDLAKSSLTAAAQVEKLRTQFEVLTGSQERAANLFKQLSDFSATTPFQLNDIADASAKLLSFGFAAENVQEKIKRIGEVAAGSNSDLKEVALIYGQVAAAGKLTGERLLQLQERAVPIGAALAKSLGVAENRVKDLVSTGVVDFKTFERAFNSLSDAGGLFEGAISKQSKTINGVISTFKDNIFLLQGELGKVFAGDFAKTISSITVSIQDLTKAVIDNKEGFSAAIGFISDYITVYTDLATQLIKTKTPIDEVNEKILETSDRIDELRALANKEGAVGFITSLIRPAAQEKELLDDLENQQAKLKELILERNKLLKESQPKVDNKAVQDNLKQEVQVNQQILDNRRKLETDLAVLRAESAIAQAEQRLADADIVGKQREDEIKSIYDFELKKAEAKALAQEQNAMLITDAQNRELELDRIFLEKRVAQNKAAAERDKRINDSVLKDRDSFFNSAISLSQSKNKTLAAIGKAAGLIQIAQATPPAVASSFNYGARLGGPPLGFAFAGVALAAQLQQAAKLSAGSFAQGGFVGGSSYTGDKLTANVNSGEAILNSRQQKNFMDIANKGIEADSAVFDLVDEVRGLMNAVMSQPMVVAIDGREIARVVRDERRAGFAI